MCLTALSALSIQIAVNFFNDAFDVQSAAPKHLRKGPLRLTPTGKLSFSNSRNIGFAFIVLSLLFGLVLIYRGGWPIALIGFMACILAYFYTGGARFSLLKMGLSELACFLFFGPLAVFGTAYLQTLKWWDSSLIYLGIQSGLWALSVLLINHLRDEEEDRLGGRKQLVTLYGRQHSLLFLVFAQALIYLLCFYWMGQGLRAGAWTFFTLPLSSLLLYFVCVSPPSSKYNLYLSLCSFLYMLFALLWLAGLLLPVSFISL